MQLNILHSRLILYHTFPLALKDSVELNYKLMCSRLDEIEKQLPNSQPPVKIFTTVTTPTRTLNDLTNNSKILPITTPAASTSSTLSSKPRVHLPQKMPPPWIHLPQKMPPPWVHLPQKMPPPWVHLPQN